MFSVPLPLLKRISLPESIASVPGARVQELLQSRLTASELAATAQSFGQQDDISVIAVTRTASLVPA